jgi:hypothetical protein
MVDRLKAADVEAELLTLKRAGHASGARTRQCQRISGGHDAPRRAGPQFPEADPVGEELPPPAPADYTGRDLACDGIDQLLDLLPGRFPPDDLLTPRGRVEMGPGDATKGQRSQAGSVPRLATGSCSGSSYRYQLIFPVSIPGWKHP